MPRSQEPTPFYIRTINGETFSVDTLDEALEEFCGEEGYRLSLKGNNVELVIRRDKFETRNLIGGEEADAFLVLRKNERELKIVKD